MVKPLRGLNACPETAGSKSPFALKITAEQITKKRAGALSLFPALQASLVILLLTFLGPEPQEKNDCTRMSEPETLIGSPDGQVLIRECT